MNHFGCHLWLALQCDSAGCHWLQPVPSTRRHSRTPLCASTPWRFSSLLLTPWLLSCITRILCAASLLATLPLSALAGPEVPGAPQANPIALVGGTVHPVVAASSGDASPPPAATLLGATILFDQGRIVAIGNDLPIPPTAERIDVTGKHIYPGLFDAYSDLGLIEIRSVRGTRDETETGTLNPNVRAQRAFNPDSELIPVARANGILTVLTVPRGGLLCGQSAVMHLDGWTWEDMTLHPAAGMHVTWPRFMPPPPILLQETEKTSADARKKALDTLSQSLADARAYLTARDAQSTANPQNPPPVDARAEALAPLLRGQQPLIVAADELQQIESAVAFALREHLRLILLGGYDAPHCAELLKQHDIPVIVAGVHRLPQRADDPYDAPFTLPAQLSAADVRFCIAGAVEATQLRNLPYHAATAVAYGLPAEEALRAVTLYPAQILGLADRIGSLAPGRDATLLVTNGDLLEITTRVERAFIQGRTVDLDSRHERLWRKYREKYRRLGSPPLSSP